MKSGGDGCGGDSVASHSLSTSLPVTPSGGAAQCSPSHVNLKNRCDKCDGTYATLAALISHKKSCKAVPNSAKRPANEYKSSSSSRIKLNFESNNKELDYERSNIEFNDDLVRRKGSTLLSSTPNSIKDGSAGGVPPVHNAMPQWPNEFMVPPFPVPGHDALSESLAQFIASANAERAESSSPASDEHNAALFTQQMMFFHMLQQLQGASQLPHLPLLAAAAAAAAQQQHHPSLSSDRQLDNSEEIGPRNFTNNDTKESLDYISRLSHLRTSAPVLNSFVPEITKTSKCQNDDKELDEPKRPLSAASSSTSVSTSQPSNTQKLISSLLDLKDTNPDVPLPPMMSPPKNDSSNSATFNEPNTLELLQKHTEQALQNTMSGGSFLLNGLSPTDSSDLLNFRKGKDGKEDPSCRHRCKFCGKVFGSDSALQIHIRSHTGERPFKCNVCGNRFTTKGNLKVHFQRHKSKYPHVKMNPHPVPEHLDKFHPPLEPPSNSQSPPPPSSSLFSSSPTSSFNNTNTLHIPAIFSSTLIPYASESPNKDTPKTSTDQSKPKTRSFFDFSNLYKGNSESKALSMSTAILSNRVDNLADESKDDSDCDEPKENMELSDSDDSDTDVECNYDKLRNKVLNPETNKDDEPQSEDEDDENDCKESKISDDMNIREKFETNKSHADSFKDEDEDNDLDVDSDEEIFGDHPDQSNGSSAGIMTPSFGFMGLPFGANPPTHPTSLTTPPNTDQPFSRDENDPELPESVASKDPNLYQNLLPKPGSTDNTWETLMEVQKASETVKLQQLVDNIEHKMNDPNQCIICQRVLSCKSALQMHYRTHTGERPFKCKICSRAFTTKGNLKTHMGVHRVKPPLRMLHQCPICHKQFTNALVLQQHLRLHAGEQSSTHSADITQEILAKFKNNPFLSPNFPQVFLPPGFGGSFPMPPGTPTGLFPPSLMPEMSVPNLPNSNSMAPFPALLSKDAVNLDNAKSIANQSEGDIEDDIDDDLEAGIGDDIDEDIADDDDKEGEIEHEVDDEIDDDINDNENITHKVELKPDCDIREEISNAQVNNELNNDKKRKLAELVKEKAAVLDDANSISDTTEIEDEQDLSPTKRKKLIENAEPEKIKVKEESNALSTLSALENHVMKATSQLGSQSTPLFLSTPSITPDKGNVLDLTPKSNSDSLSSKSSSSPAIDSRMYSSSSTPFAGLPYHPTGRPNTTCRICLKTFACFSALEIHYRSHTKERPFKCEVCDRGFSTKGNMKQHMLTHKIRDLPPDLYTTVSPSSNTTLGNFLTSSNISKLMGKHMSENDSTNNSNTSSRVSSPPTPNGNNSNSVDSTDKLRNCESPNGDQSSASSRTSGSNKHLCTLCNKPFSSGSALQIHMRTHTGDKPFKCTICGRAFTTKGNLKVHMGTHMWNNNPSRRGRRMSIDLPNLHLSPSNVSSSKNQSQPPPTSQQAPPPPPPPLPEMLPNQPNSNHDLFFPYLPPHFLNGSDANQLAMQQMMIMKMMSGQQQHQLQQQLSLGSNNKRTVPSSNEDSDNEDENTGLLKPANQVLLRQPPTINLSQNAKKRRPYFEPNSPNTNDDDIENDDEDEEENKSFKSDRSNNLQNNYLAKQWKMPCTICRHIFTSPVDFEEHIKAHLHAAVVSSTSSVSEGKSTSSSATAAASALSAAKTAGILS